MGCVLAGKDSLWGEDVQVKAEVFSDFFFSVYAKTDMDLGESFLGDLTPCDVNRFASVPTFT